MKIILKQLIIISLISFSLFAKTPTNIDIVNNMIDAYGGRTALKQLNSYKQTWEIDAKIRNVKGTEYRSVLMPNFLRTELRYPNKTEIRTVIKNYGTKQLGPTKILAQGPMLDAMKLQLMRLYTPLVLKNKIKKISLSQDENDYIFTLKHRAISAKYFISKETFLIQKVIGTLRMGLKEIVFTTFYKNYRRVKGALIPYEEIKYVGEINTAVMSLKEIEFTKPPKNIDRLTK